MVPSRRDAVRLLRSLEPPEWLVAHVSAVAEVAAFLAERVEGNGIAVDRGVVEAAALLHDIDKVFDERHPLRPLGHGDAGARWLSDHGYRELARPVAAHPVTRLSDAARYRAWAAFASREERIVAYADKRATSQLVSLADRFADWEGRSPQHLYARRVARERAERLERDVCDAARIAPSDVRRLQWVGPLFAAASAAGSAPHETASGAPPGAARA